MNINSLLNGSLQTIILKLLEDNKQMYGYEISQKVLESSGGEVLLKDGALYPALHKLEGAGFLETTSEIVDGRARKYYRLTEQGGLEATNRVNEAHAFIAHLQSLLNLKPAF